GGGAGWSQSGIHMLDGSEAYPPLEDEVELTLSAEEIIPDPDTWGAVQELAPQALPPTDSEALQEARRRAQEELVREMQEALRRSGSADDDGWLSTSPAKADVPTPTEEPMPALAPLRFGPEGRDAEQAQDLWRI